MNCELCPVTAQLGLWTVLL